MNRLLFSFLLLILSLQAIGQYSGLGPIRLSLDAGATGVQWYKDGVLIAGATGTTYDTSIPATYYATYVDASRSCAAIQTNFFVLVTAGTSVTLDGQTNNSGGSAYQWVNNGVDIPGANTSTYTTSVGGLFKLRYNNGTCEVETIPYEVYQLLPTTYTNVCPATSVNLSTVTSKNLPNNTTLTWHTGTPATNANKINDVTALSAGKYYASFYDGLIDCYSPTSEVTLVVNSCVAVVANPNMATTTANTAVNIPILNNDTNNGVAASLTNVSLPTVSTSAAHGTTSVNADGSITYTPTSGYVGTDTFIYTLCDKTQTSICDTALVTVTVGCPVLSSPTGAVASASSICSGGSSTLSASACSSGTLTWYSEASLLTALSSTTVSPAATTTYYAACVSGSCKSSSSPVTVTVITLPSAPIPTSLAKSNVCPSTTADLTSLQPSVVGGISYEWHTASSNPSAGSLVSSASSVAAGTYYLYAKNSTGCYSVASSAVTVTINACVLANPNTVSTLQNIAVSIPVLGNDTRNGVVATLTNVGLPTVTTSASHGTTSVNADGSITYTPTSGYLGTDTFIYTLCDKLQTSVCDTALVTVSIAQEVVYTFTNICPATTVDLTSHLPLTIPVGLNVTFHSTTPATAANKLTNLSVGAGQYYMAFEDDKGTAITSDDCYSPTASLNIVINQCVEAKYDVVSTLLNTAVNIPILNNDTNNGVAASLTNVSLPTVSTNAAHGTTSVNADGSITYTPTSGYVGTDTFIYTLCAKTQPSVCDTALVMVSVGCPVLSSPTGAVASASSICSGGSLTLSASACSSGTLTWYSDASLLTVLSSTTVSPAATTTYYAACVSGSCNSSSSPVTVTVITLPSAPIPTSLAKSNVCPLTTADLTSLQPSVVGGISYEWHTASSNPSAGSLVSSASSVAAGTYYLYAKNSTGCYSVASSAVTVTINACVLANPDVRSTTLNTLLNIVVLGNDTNNGSIATLTNSTLTLTTPPTIAQGTATLKLDGTIDFMPATGYVGTATFIYTLCDKTQTSICDTALVTVTIGCPVLSSPTGAVASASSICSGGSSTLSASACSSGTLTWYSDASLLTVLSSTTVSPVATTTYYAACVSGSCKSSSSPVTVTVSTLPSAPIPTSLAKSNVCPLITADLTSLEPSVVGGISYEWHTASSNPSAGNLVSSASSVAAGTYYLYAKNSTGCYSAASSAVTVTIGSCICNAGTIAPVWIVK